MLIIFVLVFSFAICSIIYLLFPLKDIKEFINIVKYMHNVKKEKKRMSRKGS